MKFLTSFESLSHRAARHRHWLHLHRLDGQFLQVSLFQVPQGSSLNFLFFRHLGIVSPAQNNLLVYALIFLVCILYWLWVHMNSFQYRSSVFLSVCHVSPRLGLGLVHLGLIDDILFTTLFY